MCSVDKLALGTYTLMTYSALAGTGTSFTLGTTPGGSRSYGLTTDGTDVLLTVSATVTERYWSTTGGTPPVDGAGTWQNGSTTFYNNVPSPGISQANAPYDSNATADVIFGNGGNGGTVTITGPVAVNGALVFSAVKAASPYTIASSGSGNSLTLSGGIARLKQCDHHRTRHFERFTVVLRRRWDYPHRQWWNL